MRIGTGADDLAGYLSPDINYRLRLHRSHGSNLLPRAMVARRSRKGLPARQKQGTPPATSGRSANRMSSFFIAISLERNWT